MLHAITRTWGLALVFSVVLGVQLAQAQCTLPHTLSNGQPPDATKVMANFNALVACANAAGSTNSVQYNAGSGALGGVGPLTNGQVVAGSTGNPPQAATLTAGSGVTVSNGAGQITIGAVASPSAGLYRQVMSALPTAVNTGLSYWINQGAATFSEGTAGISVSSPSGADELKLRYGPAPVAPYTLTTLIGATRNSTASGEVGIGWYDGVSKFHIFSFAIPAFSGAQAFLQVAKWSAYNFRIGNDVAANTAYYSQPIWLQLKDDGTNVTFAFSHDGANFLTLFTSAKTSAYLGANGYNNFILFVNPRGGQAIATAMSWAIN